MAKRATRDKHREAYWRKLIRKRERSGLTIRGYCRENNLPESAFYFWRRELERRDGTRGEAEQEQRKRPPARAAFVPVRVMAAPAPVARDDMPGAPGRIEIELSGGQRVHVTAPVDRQALAEVLAVLSTGPDDSRIEANSIAASA